MTNAKTLPKGNLLIRLPSGKRVNVNKQLLR